ncbi:RNase H family protein [Clavibacter michiganensis]|uniref:Ribonuclease H n=4 Tax=Clavibacter michiganensis TaxID=28447 RepID=A0A225CCV5_CLAMM|nr:RNase H family protein [Clavibacter michiganensis]KAF0258570.1 Ribonuclease HI [Clavibacter michiganensis subsp. michiganensis]MBE3077744.1 ribbon-helix-helix protein, CopG family [Clavibacter michiganensis subsp. michiganensis]MBF4637270.1 ribbon-helix-helix protein, CopG family [Clavibacter michiganensis subsp. michiganensis]MBW8025519.1 ribbon-helix-helix protein, CopG family [Clavibacter michiganensis subsp. michiganensis]MDO4019896.1 ribbon-helix-helix protein, CopG family [Clavibacter
MTITAAADGSALGNPGPAGWAWYVDDEHWAAGGWAHATNNQGELKAVLELFRATAHLDDDLLVLCDSQYVINSVTKWMPGWKRKGWRKGDGKPVLNVELLKEIDAEIQGRRYRFEWVKGHANHPLNEAADVRARAVATAFQGRSAIPAGPGWAGHDADEGAASPDDTTETAAVAADAERAADPVTAAAEELEAEAPAQPGLFDFDAFDEEIAPEPGDTTLTIALDRDTMARLSAHARERGVSVDEAVRELLP